MSGIERFFRIFDNRPSVVLPPEVPDKQVEKPVEIRPPIHVSKTPWFDLAHHELGVSETKNPKRVIEYLKSTTLESNLCVPSTPWCSAFVCWCLEQAGVNSTKQAWAKSYLNFGFKTDRPNPGDIVVFSRGRASGHVAFFVSSGLFTVTVLGGNQGDQVCIKDYPKFRVLGYRTLIN